MKHYKNKKQKRKEKTNVFVEVRVCDPQNLSAIQDDAQTHNDADWLKQEMIQNK